MKRLSALVLLSMFVAAPAITPASAQNAACTAMSAEGKPLAGAAKTSHMKKCCETNAKSSEGKPLSGAAKKSSVDKCMKG